MGEKIEVFCDLSKLRKFPLMILAIFISLMSSGDSYASVDAFEDHLQQDIDSLSQLALEHHSWAVKHYAVSGMLDSVIVRARLALEIREHLWKENPTIDLGKSYHNLGTFLKFKGDYDEAKKYLKEAVGVYKKLEHDRVLRSLLELGKIYKQEGDFVSAEEYFKLVIQFSEERKLDPKIRAAVVDLGSTYIDASQDSMAVLFLEKYIGYFDVDNKEDKDIVGKYYNNLATAYLRTNKYDQAINTFKKASLFDQSNFITQAKIYTNLAIAFRLKNEYKECYKALMNGKELAYRSKNLEQMAFSHKGLAKYHEFRSEYKLALAEYQKAISLITPSFVPTDEYSNPTHSDLSYVVNKINLLAYLSDKVKILIALDKKKYKKEILELYSLGDAVIDDMRSDHFMDGAKLYWRADAFPFYEDALEYCYEEEANEEAFYFFEKSKSVLLLEGYSFNEAISKIADEDKERYLNLKTELGKLQNGNVNASIEDIVFSQRNFETFIDSLSLTYPHLFNKYEEEVLLSLNDFQNEFVTDPTNLFIHYFYGKENVFAFGIKNNATAFLNLGETKMIDSLVNNLKQFFHHPAQIDNDFNAYKRASNEVYKMLLAPLISNDEKEIVLLPDGPLATIPFEALISKYEEGQEVKYVIQDWLIRYSFSGSILSNMKDSDQRGDFDVLCFVPFENNKQMKGVNFSGVMKKDLKSARKNGLKVKYYLGNEANKTNLYSYGERLPILHFSSHGFENEGEEPKILLANSSIALSDLYTSSLPSDMVFLSACRTNLGENAYGEGIQSIARGFAFAGANSVISSLWNVVADPNSSIVRRFYENLAIGKSKHLALHNAKLAYLQDSRVPLFEKSPYYWAGLIYYGESDHILKPQSKLLNHKIFTSLLITFFMVISFFGVRYYKFKT